MPSLIELKLVAINFKIIIKDKYRMQADPNRTSQPDLKKLLYIFFYYNGVTFIRGFAITLNISVMQKKNFFCETILPQIFIHVKYTLSRHHLRSSCLQVDCSCPEAINWRVFVKSCSKENADWRKNITIYIMFGKIYARHVYLEFSKTHARIKVAVTYISCIVTLIIKVVIVFKLICATKYSNHVWAETSIHEKKHVKHNQNVFYILHLWAIIGYY